MRWLALLLVGPLSFASAATAQGRGEGVAAAPICAPSGRLCISVPPVGEDLCIAMDMAARTAGLERDFFVRLIWRESRFDPAALSPAGAQGIAQFMPGTARIRGLADPWNPAEALEVSALYLAFLRDRFGSLGAAAVAYNAGERRASEWLGANPWLPGETLAYVPAITGVTAADWRTDPPETLDLALEGASEAGFLATCAARAIGEYDLRPALQPWGVMLAAHRTDTAARSSAERLRRSHADLFGADDILISRRSAPGLAGLRQVVQVGRADRAAARSLCSALRARGAICRVIRN